MTNMELLLKELLEQDNELRKIYKRRKEIRKIAENGNFYDELWELLYKDDESHCEF